MRNKWGGGLQTWDFSNSGCCFLVRFLLWSVLYDNGFYPMFDGD